MTCYVNLTDYYQLTDNINACIAQIESICPNSKTEGAEGQFCSVTAAQLRNRLKATTYQDENMAGYRYKRHCNWCGKFLKWSTGVMDADTAIVWQDFLNKVKNETKLQHNEIYNQTAIFRAFLDTNRDTIHNTELILTQLQKTIKTVSEHEDEEMEKVQERLKIQSLFQLAEAALTEHERIYLKIRNSISEARRGRIPELIVKKNLADHLRNISVTLPSEQRLPIDIMLDDPLHIFRYSDVSTALFDDHLLLKIVIPIAERERFSLFKATAIPVTHWG